MNLILLAPPVTDEATRRQFLAVLAAGGLLAGCGEDGAPTTAASAPATRSVTHFFGTTEVPVAPERIVVVATPVLGNLVELGVTVAATVEPNVAGSQDYLGDRLDAIAKLGTQNPLDVEAVAALDPDLIVTIGVDFARELYDSVREVAATVAPAYGDATVEQVRTFLLECGVCVGREERARELAETLDGRIDVLRDLISDTYGERTATLLRVSSGSYSVRVGDTAAGLLEALGVRRPAGQEFDAEKFSLDLSLERIGDLAGADTIFLYTDADAADSRESLEDNPLWATLPAVQQDRVFFVPAAVWAVGVDVVAINLILDDIELRLTEKSATATPSPTSS